MTARVAGAAGLAQADPWKTSWIALEMGLATFIVPFMFFFSPVLLMQGTWPEIIQAGITASIGVLFLGAQPGNVFGQGRESTPTLSLGVISAISKGDPGVSRRMMSRTPPGNSARIASGV